MLIEAKDEVRESVNALLALAAQYERGQVIPWSAITATVSERVMDGAAVARDDVRYVVQKWRAALLRDREIATRPVRDVGVRLLTREEQVRECARDRRVRAHRQLGRGLREVAAVDNSSLNDQDRRLQALTVAAMKDERRALRKGLKGLVGRKSDTRPQLAIH